MIRFFKGCKIKRSSLVYEVVEPVGIQEICAGSPSDDGILGIVVARIIIFRHFDIKSAVFVPQIFSLQSEGVVF